MNTSSTITQKLKLQNIPIGPSTGDDMGVCEICGAEKVGTRSARSGRTTIDTRYDPVTRVRIVLQQ